MKWEQIAALLGALSPLLIVLFNRRGSKATATQAEITNMRALIEQARVLTSDREALAQKEIAALTETFRRELRAIRRALAHHQQWDAAALELARRADPAFPASPIVLTDAEIDLLGET